VVSATASCAGARGGNERVELGEFWLLPTLSLQYHDKCC